MPPAPALPPPGAARALLSCPWSRRVCKGQRQPGLPFPCPLTPRSPPSPADSETGEDEPSDPQVTQRSELQDETAFSTPTGEQGEPGWHRALAPAAGHGRPTRALLAKL